MDQFTKFEIQKLKDAVSILTKLNLGNSSVMNEID